MMRYYCTYFDHNYLARGLALYESMERQGGDFKLYVLCLSEACFDALAKLNRKSLVTIRLADLEKADAELLSVKPTRSIIEYYFTSTPCLPRYIFQKFPEVDLISYLDSDLYFFGDPEKVFAGIGNASIAITPHRFPAALKDEERHGIFNVGWVTFRRDEQGLACLELWRAQCLEWCHDRLEGGRYADQKYLDAWPAKFSNLKILDHPGINTAPWNLAGCAFTMDWGVIKINGQPLLVYHFHGLKLLTRHIYTPHWAEYQARSNPILRHQIYAPYLKHLEALKHQTAHLQPVNSIESVRVIKSVPKTAMRRWWRASILRKIWYGIRAWIDLWRGKNVFVWQKRIQSGTG